MSLLISDPISDMFSQTSLNLETSLAFLNNQSNMENLKSNFLSAYYNQLERLDAHFLKELPSLQFNQPTKNTLSQRNTENNSDILEESCWSHQRKRKRNKLTKNEYVEKILMDFGYQGDQGFQTVTLESNRRTMPHDERITVKLFNPEEEVHQDFGPSYDEYRPVTDKKNTQATIKKEYPSISVTGSESHKDSIQNTTKKSDMTFRNSDAYPERSGSKKGQNFGASESKSITDLKSPFGLMKINPNEGNPFAVVNSNQIKKGKASLRKSLMQDFEEASHKDSKIEEVQLPSEDKNCHKELEDLISTFNIKPKAKLLEDKQRHSAVFSLPKTETTKCTSTLSNQVHNILFAQPFDLSVDSMEEQKTGDEFFSFENHENEEKAYEIIDNIQYDLTDYSDNSSSNVGSYNFREEEIELPGHNTKMFQYFGNVQLNLKDSQSYGYEADPFTFNKFESQEMGMLQNSQPSQTLFHDYMYYLRQNNQNGASQSLNEDNEREKRLSKLNGSPTKMQVRTKKLFCNDKEVPNWAWDLNEIEKVSKDQKKVFNTDEIFGSFNVDNLNLVEVFQRVDHKFIRPRGSSANWKNDADTPSGIKQKELKKKNLEDLSKTKKTIVFKSGTKGKTKK